VASSRKSLCRQVHPRSPSTPLIKYSLWLLWGGTSLLVRVEGLEAVGHVVYQHMHGLR